MELLNRVTYAKLLVELGALNEAEREIAEILESRSDPAVALSLLAKVKHIRGELSAAVACWAELQTHGPHGEEVRLHLLAMLQLAQDPERGAGEYLALGHGQLVRKPLPYLALERAFQLFVSRRPAEARRHCRHVAELHRGGDRDLYRLAVMAEAFIADLSGDTEDACAILERLGEERGFETDLERVTTLADLYERIGTPERLEAAVNIWKFQERTVSEVPVLGRLALLHRRLGRTEAAASYEERHLRSFKRGMLRLDLAEVAHVAARRYIPLPLLCCLLPRLIGDAQPAASPSARELAVTAALTRDDDRARAGFEEGAELIDRKYLADLAAVSGDSKKAASLFLSTLEEGQGDLYVLSWLLDAARNRSQDRLREALASGPVNARAHRLLEQALEQDSSDEAAWRRLATLAALEGRGLGRKPSRRRPVIAKTPSAASSPPRSTGSLERPRGSFTRSGPSGGLRRAPPAERWSRSGSWATSRRICGKTS